MAKTTFIQLGKLGDVLNILPMLRMASEPQRLMVASDYFPALEGVSYVEPVEYRGLPHELDKATQAAAALGGPVVCTQVNAPRDLVREFTYKPAGLTNSVTTSFQKESWRIAGRLADWDDQPELLFDRRNHAREEELFNKTVCRTYKRPIVLFYLGGISSPFPYAKLVRELIHLKFPDKKWTVVDLGEVKAHRFFDLLVLYDRAKLLISTDSAPLHLARACPNLPVMALANDQPSLWNGSPWRPNHVWYCRYRDFPVRGHEMIHRMDMTPIWRCDGPPKIVKVFNAFSGDLEYGFCLNWMADSDGRFVFTPIELGSCAADSANVKNIGDEKRVPFLKDCLRMGLQRARPDDWVMLTRTDTCFAGPLPVGMPESAFAYRIERNGHGSMFYPVADMFCAKKAWWKARLTEIPNLLFGNDIYWPQTLAAMFTKYRAKDLTGVVYREAKA